MGILTSSHCHYAYSLHIQTVDLIFTACVSFSVFLKVSVWNMKTVTSCPLPKPVPLVPLTYLFFVDLLSAIGHLVTYDSANVLDDHGVLLQILSSVQTQALNAGSGQIHIVLPLGLQATILGGL